MHSCVHDWCKNSYSSVVNKLFVSSSSEIQTQALTPTLWNDECNKRTMTAI